MFWGVGGEVSNRNSYNVFYSTYESCILMEELTAKLDCGAIV